MSMMADGPERESSKIVAGALPDGVRLHPEFGVMSYSDPGTLRLKFGAPKFDGLEDRELEIVPASSVGAHYEFKGSTYDIAHGYNVVISRPKASEREPEESKTGHTIRWGTAGGGWIGFQVGSTPEAEAESLAKLSIAADKAHRIMTGEGVSITEIDGHATHIPVSPPDHPDPARIRALFDK